MEFRPSKDSNLSFLEKLGHLLKVGKSKLGICVHGILFLLGNNRGVRPCWIKRSGNCGVHATFQIYFRVNFAYSCSEIPAQPQTIIIGKVIVSRFWSDTIYAYILDYIAWAFVQDQWSIMNILTVLMKRSRNWEILFKLSISKSTASEWTRGFCIYDQTIILGLNESSFKY